MPLLTEYALTPDVFDTTSYDHEEVCGLRLQILKDVLLEEGLVRNLWDGEWSKLFSKDFRPWHRRGKELLKKLRQRNRLVLERPTGPVFPSTDLDWCAEAVATHKVSPLAGIIVTEKLSHGYRDLSVLAPINKLSITPWWCNRSYSVRLSRSFDSYRCQLLLILRHAKSIMFIDPHLDPTQARYSSFKDLLIMAGPRNPAPLIEIHRVCYRGSGRERRILGMDEIEEAFQSQLATDLQSVGLVANIFIWDDFHDRYLISNLISIDVPNGFDTTSNSNALTTWTRLARPASDDIQREFDPASNRHNLKRRFTVP